jgi:Tol biopolymer transport system component
MEEVAAGERHGAYVTLRSFMGRRSGRVLLTLLLLLAGAGAARAASFPPELRFRSLSTGRVTVHFHQGLEPLARRAVVLASEILARHEARYGVRVGRLQLVLADVDDDPNGFASPLPYPLVHVRAVAPDGSEDFGNYDDWLRLVLTHELTHVVHLEEARGVLRLGRKVFGRAPFLFPNASTPTWMVEGLATYEETQGTAFGRGRNPDVRMVLRMAALEDDFVGEDRAVAGLDRWPGGLAAYFFGEAFLADLAARVGPSVLPDLARVHSGRVIPFLDELTARKVTGSTFHALWKRWRRSARAAFEGEAEAIRARGLTPSRALTTRGVRQAGPRFSPDGQWIAFTDRDLTHFRSIHVIRPDGSGESEVVKRNGGSSVAWTPDGRRLVYEEPETYRRFAVRSDLRMVEVATGRKRRLTRGLRARDPDVSPDGRTVVFVRQRGDGSDLAVIGLDGAATRDLTRSAPGVQWSAPQWSPAGDALVASRWMPGGMLDIVRVDPVSGTVTPLTEDRAKDVEPVWTPDAAHVLFRSDRDGVSNLYALRIADGAVLRVTNVLGGAFTPDVSPDGRHVAFAGYSARGYDLQVMDLDLAALAPAEPFHDPYPAAAVDPPPSSGPDRPYRPAALVLPRFWTPYADATSKDTKVGAVTGGTDVLFRHAWVADVRYGTGTERIGGQLFYQYDRFLPTFTVHAEDKSDLASEGLTRSRELTVRATLPLHRSLRVAHSLSLAWRRRRETLEGTEAPGRVDLGGIEAAWAISTARMYPYSISPVDGYRVRLAYVKEAPGLGSDVSLGKMLGDARLYSRLFRADDAIAVRLAGGLTVGRPAFQRSFAVGGFPDGVLFDVVGTNHAVLRGYPDDAFLGRRFVDANLEYRFPLGHPQRGFRLLPIFVRHLHATVFADAGHAWTGTFRLRDLKTAAGAALGSDVMVGHGLPLTLTAGVARGFADRGETRAYFRAGLAF